MSAWRMTWHGLRTVTQLELRQRVRSRRWFVALAAWFVLLTLLTIAIVLAVATSGTPGVNNGVISFGLATYLILGMSLVVAPTFTATAINGDRSNGTLALLQASRLTAAEIAGGKLLAAWLTAGMFLLVSLPIVAWSLIAGAISVWLVVICYAVMFAEVAVVCAIGLGWSALIHRSAGSTVMTYLTVVTLALLTPIFLALALPFTEETRTVRVWALSPQVEDEYQRQLEEYWQANPDGDGRGQPAPPFGQCAWQTQERWEQRIDRVWWLVVANPFVIVADAAPLPATARGDLAEYVSETSDPLTGLQLLVRQARAPLPTEYDECRWIYTQGPGYQVEYDRNGNVINVTTAEGTRVPVESPVTRPPVTTADPIWPWGLGFSALLGGGFFWVAVRRLRVPYGKLASGTRVA
ncbi:MAG: ABC transporter permease [Propioniciclava sp.]